MRGFLLASFLYFLIATSYYVLDVFDSIFAITTYWGLAASLLLFFGI